MTTIDGLSLLPNWISARQSSPVPPQDTKTDLLGAFDLVCHISISKRGQCSPLRSCGRQSLSTAAGTFEGCRGPRHDPSQINLHMLQSWDQSIKLVNGTFAIKKNKWAKHTQQYWQKEVLPYSLFSRASGRVNKSTLNIVQETCNTDTD